MIKLYLLFALSFLLLIPNFHLHAQKTDSTKFLEASISNARMRYDSKFPKQDELANGREYVDYDNRITGHPYFDYDGYGKGSVTYRDHYFDDLNLKYDIIKDILVMEHYDQSGYRTDIYLINEWVSSFEIEGYYFKKLFQNEKEPELDPGFYNILIEGDARLICRRKKRLHEDIDLNRISREFLLDDKFYIINNGEAHKVKNARSVFKAFPNEKKRMKQYVKKNKYLFRSDFEAAVIDAVNFFNDLNK